jgi:sugar phosphate isomerase/epimerase
MDIVVGGASPAETFRRAGRLGFSGVEVWLTRDELRSPRQERLASLREARDRTSLAIPSLVLGEHLAGGIAHRDPTIAGAAIEDVRQAIDWGLELGSRVILVPFFDEGELRSVEDVDRAVSAFRSLCAIAGPASIVLGYEGTIPAADVRALAARIESDAFGCYFDLANPLSRGLDPGTELRALGDLVVQVHLKDARVKGGDCPPGLGRVDFDDCAFALTEIGYDGWLVLETPAAPPELVARDLSFAACCFPTLERLREWPRLGAFSYDFGAGEWDRLATTLEGYGLEAVQLGGPLLDELLDEPDRAESIATELASHGITVAGVAGYRNLVAPAAGKRKANLEYLERCLALAPRLGTSVVATETGTRDSASDWAASPENRTGHAWHLLLDAVETLLPVAEEHGAILALEAHVNNVLATQGQLLDLLERFSSQHLQAVLDPYNYLSAHLLPARERITADFLDRFEHRFVLAHGKDVSTSGAESGTPEFGTGVFSQRPYLEFLRTRRPDLPLILEHLPLEHLPRAIQRVREFAPAEEQTRAAPPVSV